METNGNSNQPLIFKSTPVLAAIISAALVAYAIFLFTTDKEALVTGIIFLVIGIGVFALLGRASKVVVDPVQRTLMLSKWSLFSRKKATYAFSDVAAFEVDVTHSHSSSGHNRQSSYRVVMVTKNGEKVPVDDVYSGGYGPKAQKAKQLSQAVGLENWEDKPTNLFQAAMQAQVAYSVKPELSRNGNMAGVDWTIEVHQVGNQPVTRWICKQYSWPENFLLVSQKPQGNPMSGGGGLLGSLALMAYQQIIAMYGFVPTDTPNFQQATPVTPDDPNLAQHYALLSNNPIDAACILNAWTTPPLLHWASRHPLKKVSYSPEQLVVLYSPNGLYVTVFGSLDAQQTDELIAVSVELAKAQGIPQQQ